MNSSLADAEDIAYPEEQQSMNLHFSIMVLESLDKEIESPPNELILLNVHSLISR